MNPITTFNAWLLSKITNSLTIREGCTVEKTHYTADGIQAIVRDSFGYRYEVHVKTLSRVQYDSEDFDAEKNYKQNISGIGSKATG